MILKRILKRKNRSGSQSPPDVPRSPGPDPAAELDSLLSAADRRDAPRLRELLAAGEQGLTVDQRLDALRRCDDPVLLAYVARNGREAELRLAAVDRANGERLLEEVALHDRVSRVRQRAAGRLQAREALERVWRAARGQDARVARVARQRLDELESVEARVSAARDAHEQLCVEAERLSESLPLEAVEAAVQRLRNRWDSQAVPASAERTQRFQRALDAALQQLQADRARRQPVQARIRALDELAAEVTRANAEMVTEVQHALEKLEREPLPGPVPADLQPTLRRAEERLQHWLEDMRAWFAHQGSIEAMLDALDDPAEQGNPVHRRHLQEQLDALPWRTALPEPEVLHQARERLRTVDRPAQVKAAAAPDHREASLQPVRQALQAVLPEAATALDEGDLRRARRLLNRAQHKAESLPRRERQQVDEQLRPLLARAQELQDWRRFAVLPKQEALCERMEALAAEPLVPQEQVDAIKALRAEWKALGGSDSRESRKLWERFQAAAEQAFEPCRAWYQAQREERKRHLRERERIVGQLERFLETEGWDDTPVKDLERIHATAKAEWRAASPVDPQAARGLKRRFRKAMDRLGEVLGAHRQSIREEKKHLLEEARSLADQDDLGAAAARARELQARWRELPPLPTGEERRRHRELRAVCDRVFQRLRDRDVDQGRQQQQGRQAAELLCQRLEDAVAGHPEAAALQRLLSEVRREWSGLPPRSRQSVEKRFRKAEAAVNRQLDALRRAAWVDSLEPLQRAAGLVREAEALAQGGTSSSEALGEAWERLPADIADDTLRQRWDEAMALYAQGGGFDAGRLERVESERRRLCVELEILAGVDSPEADRELRMRLQVERLSASLGSQPSETVHTDGLEQLVQDWYRLGPWPLDVDGAWETRFHKALGVAAGLHAGDPR
ncbi:MAG: DUF349 domain-containing protein [Ectothiorhodospiraceae bacterium]|nr:DUF349 domain-containing protein [Ectothiorhodospiraceae bacterium]